jgi:tRNA threonylcarbamoyladenosine biosynthesis protein TsaE
MSGPVVVHSDSPSATKATAGRLARICRSGDIILLIGELGAGKTAFAQGFAAALGVEGPVTSPTFTLVRQYRCADGSAIETLMHADVYRTGSLHEVAELALAELVEEQAVALVEWGDLAAPALGHDALEVTLAVPVEAPAETTDRVISVTGRGAWSSRMHEVAGALKTSSSAEVTP